MSLAGAERTVLALDLGSGAVKAALVSRRGEVQASAMRPLRTQVLPGGGVEQDAEEWWTATLAAARETIAAAAPVPGSVAAVVCTTQWAVTVPVDRQGSPLGPAISWMDTRGGPFNREITAGWPRVSGYGLRRLLTWIRLTGGAPAPSGVDGLGHVGFLRHERPEVYAAAWKLLEPMDYLNFRLTGRCAASFGTIFPYWLTDNRDPNHIDYHPTLLRWSGVDRDKMPDLLPVDAVLGPLRPDVARDLGLPAETPVLMGSCDGHSAAVGAGAVEDGVGYFYVGTSAWMSCHVPRKKTDVLHSITTMPAALPGRYVVMAEQGLAGRCLEFLKDHLLFPEGDEVAPPPEDPWGYLNRLAAAVPPGSDGLIFTPWINGVLAPGDDAWTRSAFFNQSLRTRRGHYVRAVMEGVAYNLRWLRGHVEKFVGQPFQDLRFLGGGAQSDLWCQIMADILGCPIRQVAAPRSANAVGAALTAFAALGEIRPEEIGGLVGVARTWQPDPANRLTYERGFREFLAFYERLKPVYRRLNRPTAT